MIGEVPTMVWVQEASVLYDAGRRTGPGIGLSVRWVGPLAGMEGSLRLVPAERVEEQGGMRVVHPETAVEAQATLRGEWRIAEPLGEEDWKVGLQRYLSKVGGVRLSPGSPLPVAAYDPEPLIRSVVAAILARDPEALPWEPVQR